MDTPPSPRTPFIVGLIGAVIILSGLVWYIIHVQKSQTVSSTPSPSATLSSSSPVETATPTPSPTTSPSSDPIASWQTYQNKTPAFSFKYPSDWSYQLIQNNTEVSLTPKGKQYTIDGHETGVIRLVASPDTAFNKDNYKDATTVTFNGHTAYKTNGFLGAVSTTFNINNVPVSVINNTAALENVEKSQIDGYNKTYNTLLTTITFN